LENVEIKLPVFETQTDKDLVSIMSKLGMADAFNEDRAEFPGFCDRRTFINQMFQSSHIKVNEDGAEAAAVTGVGMATNSIGSDPGLTYIPFYATRPFLYIISQQSTGAIFFIGQFVG
jgi:serpin B